jgi:hypothetical protein
MLLSPDPNSNVGPELLLQRQRGADVVAEKSVQQQRRPDDAAGTGSGPDKDRIWHNKAMS